ncbi:MAG: hypothetical protein AMS20_06695 [Gemmatimonas sp. SG8_28]|nr:MAG: hypothetical protein AMS20_06695 [Gemmatimonas sp. SG8_28]
MMPPGSSPRRSRLPHCGPLRGDSEEIADQLPRDPAVPGKPRSRSLELADQVLPRRHGTLMLRWMLVRVIVGVLRPRTESTDPLGTWRGPTGQRERERPPAQALEVALSLLERLAYLE